MSMLEEESMDGPSFTKAIKFATLITLLIPSILISLIIFAYFIYHRRTRVTNYNHSILLLLAINFLQVITDLPMPIDFFRTNGHVRPATATYCTWWVWYEFSLNTLNGFLMAWISFERHILIFHHHLIQAVNTWKQRLLHFFPLMVCCTWPPCFYLVAVVISPMCTSQWSFDALLCTIPCYLTTSWGIFDLFFNVISPTCLIFVMNLLLFLRILYQQMKGIGRTRQNRHRERKLALQLGLISLVYLSVWMPLSILQLGLNYISPTFMLDLLDVFNFMVYIVPLILPALCLMSMPEVTASVKRVACQRGRGRVLPHLDTMAQPRTTNLHSTAATHMKY